MSEQPSVSIVIVNWKVRDLLRLCLQSVFEQALMPASSFEVIVVDNDSGDGSVEMLRDEFPMVTVIASATNVGFGAANNLALARCRGKYILLLNPDTVVLDHALDVLLERISARPDIALLGCRLLNGDRSLQKWTGGTFPTLWNVACHYLFLDRILPRALRPSALYLERDVNTDIEVDWICGACMIFSRDKVGDFIFDESFFMYGEDMELCQRLGHFGKIVYTPAVSIIHYQGASMKQQQGDALLSSLKGLRSIFLMNHPKAQTWLFDAVTLAGFGLRWILYSLSGAHYREKARSSKQFMQLAWKIMASNPQARQKPQ